MTHRGSRVPRSRRVRAAIAALAVIAGGVLSACDPEQLGAAAVVGDERLTVSQVQQQVRDYADSLPRPIDLARLDLSTFQRRLVQDFVTHQLLLAVAQDKGIEVTEAQIDKELATLRAQGDQQYAQLLAQQGYTEDSVRDYVFDQLVAQQLGGSAATNEALTAAAERLHPWVSPRYGTLEGFQIKDTSGSLSVPVSPTPTPSPAGP